MLRVTIRDHSETITFLTDETLARLAVTACTREPGSVAALLQGLEQFRPGSALAIVRELLASDAALAAGEAVDARCAFQVYDAAGGRVANTPAEDGLIAIDLSTQTVVHERIAGEPIRASGRVSARQLDSDLERETLYTLGPSWVVLDRAAVPVHTRALVEATGA